MQENVQKSFNEIIRVLKPGGEARLYPLYINEYENHRKPWIDQIQRKINELRKNTDLEISLEEVKKLLSTAADDAVRETYARVIIKKLPPQEKTANTENIEKEIIETIENYPHLNPLEKVEILLVLGEFKQSNEQDFESEEWYDDQPPRHVDDKIIESFELLLKKTGLAFEKRKEIMKSRFGRAEDDFQFRRNIEGVRYIFSKTKEGVDKYKRAEEEQNDRLFGEIYGFPETAIEAYKKPGEKIKHVELSQEIRSHEAYEFLNFMPSRKNFQQEFETAIKWAKFVKQNSPEIYYQYLKCMKKVSQR